MDATAPAEISRNSQKLTNQPTQIVIIVFLSFVFAIMYTSYATMNGNT